MFACIVFQSDFSQDASRFLKNHVYGAGQRPKLLSSARAELEWAAVSWGGALRDDPNNGCERDYSLFGLNILFFQKHTYCTKFQIHIVAKFQIQKNRWEHFSLLQLNPIRIRKDSCFLFCIVQDWASIFDRVLLLSWIYQSGRNSRMSKRFVFTLQPLFPPSPLLPTSTIRELTSTEARTSSENVTSRFCNHFSIIQTHYVWKNVF